MASAAAAIDYVKIAQGLPPRLLNFVKRYPPPAVAVLSRDPNVAKKGRYALYLEKTDKAAIASEPITSLTDAATVAPATSATAPSNSQIRKTPLNPFLPWKNPLTGKWRGAMVSLRRQADLYKIANANNALALMPLGPKHPDVRLQQRIENGLRVQGTGIGKKVKGKYWERTMRVRLEARKKAMEGMPELIKEWQSKGYGRRWKKWPK